MVLVLVIFNFPMLGASGVAGPSQQEATASLTMAPSEKENLLGGFLGSFS